MAFIRAPFYESYYFGVIRPGFLNQVPTLGIRGQASEASAFVKVRVQRFDYSVVRCRIPL